MTLVRNQRSVDEAIVVERLVKRYGRLTAVDALSFAVPSCTIFGFEGPAHNAVNGPRVQREYSRRTSPGDRPCAT